MANMKSEQQWLSICVSLGCQEPIMDWGGHGALFLPGELLMDSGGGTVIGVYQAAIQFQTYDHTQSWLESEGHKTKGCRHRKGAVGGKDGRGRREMRELG